MIDKRTFIESDDFPINSINNASVKEKSGGGRPDYWEMVFWWTRKPLAGARAIVAGALLPENTNKANFINWLRLNAEGLTHRVSPALPEEVKEKFSKAALLDPFAGFGSIPLEAVRLNVGEVVAVEFLPSIYVFLKVVLEYPKEYGERLRSDVERWGNWITKKLREDPDVKELYEEDVAVYIGTWEVKCPICKKYTPLVGNWWLAKVKGKKYAYMKPKPEGDKVSIEVVEGKSEGAPSPNIKGRPKLAECLLCGSQITYIDPKTNSVFRSKDEVRNKIIRDGLEFYPKYAIKEWNQKVEDYLDGKISLKELKDSLARPRLLVKVRLLSKDLSFEPADEEDNGKLWRALEKLKKVWGDPDIPTESIAIYENRAIWTQPYGLDKFYRLFNSRQLLILVKLVKLIREAGKRVEEELKGNWDKEEAFKYAEAITTFLAIALARMADFNCSITNMNVTNPWGVQIAPALAMRGLSMQFPYGETSLFATEHSYLLIQGSWVKCLRKILEGLSYLVTKTPNTWSKVKVLLNDATTLNRLGIKEFDLIVTDPPYRDDVPYTELSDFFYVWLKRALSDEGLAPRFHADVLTYNTQWEVFALSEISYDEGRLKHFGVEAAESYYESLLGMAFKRMSDLLKDGGLLVTYFAHSSPEAWIELIEAGWRRAELRVTKAWNLTTEFAQRVIARGKTALGSSIVVVWRKRAGEDERIGDYRDVYREALENAKRAKDAALKSNLVGSDLFLATMIGSLSTFTSYDKVLRFGRELSSRDIVRESYAIATRIIANATEAVRSPEALFYLASKAVNRIYARPVGQLTIEGLLAEPIVMSSQDVIILSYGFLKEEVKEEKEGVKLFEGADIIASSEELKGAKVAQQKAFILLEPLDSSLKNIKEVLGRRGLNPIKMEAPGRSLNAIDALHLLEYYAKQGRREFDSAYQVLYGKCPELVREAVEVARVIKGFLGDPESALASLLVEYVEGGR